MGGFQLLGELENSGDYDTVSREVMSTITAAASGAQGSEA
jgi:hypothetical protein